MRQFEEGRECLITRGEFKNVLAHAIGLELRQSCYDVMVMIDMFC